MPVGLSQKRRPYFYPNGPLGEISKADVSHEILREELRTFEQIRVERFSSETLNTSIRLVLSASALDVTRFTTPPVGHYTNTSN